MQPDKRAFTLIELLIVVAIIAVLAAIALPNFLEAQLRSKISRVKGDFRNIGIAIEAYQVDYNHYPPGIGVGLALNWEQMELSLWRLTTPVAYITSAALESPFANTFRIRREQNTRPIYFYVNYEPILPREKLDIAAQVDYEIATGLRQLPYPPGHRAWILQCAGPDCMDNNLYWADWDWENRQDVYFVYCMYDPTNGTVSSGDFGRMGGAIRAKRVAGALNK